MQLCRWQCHHPGTAGGLSSGRSDSCCPPPQLQYSEAFRGPLKTPFLLLRNPICQTFQPHIWEEANHTLKLCSSALQQVVQEMSFRCTWPQRPIPVFLVVSSKENPVAHKGVTTASPGLGMGGRTPSCCPPHGLYNALCFGAITPLTAMTKAAHLVSKSPPDCWIPMNGQTPTTSSRDFSPGKLL